MSLEEKAAMLRASTARYEVSRILAGALGYEAYQPGEPGYVEGEETYITGDHTVETLAEEAAELIAVLRANAREALLSEETVERAARALWYGGESPDDPGTTAWEDAPEKLRESIRQVARAVLTAALGEEGK
ncbi:hypothetical protein [Brevibacterium album]|uniref:hypothetical protein n=1 Tax=Brevibacterium album TaxID=417948 RepID=UPI0004154CAB|nr:hypothetical protein [Brevibacterium album]